MQTFLTTLANLDKFAYIGGFSGSTGGFGGKFRAPDTVPFKCVRFFVKSRAARRKNACTDQFLETQYWTGSGIDTKRL